MQMTCCHENVLTEMLDTKKPRFYSWLRYLAKVFIEALSSIVLFQAAVPKIRFYNPFPSNGPFRHITI